jgi:hypothetical protein
LVSSGSSNWRSGNSTGFVEYLGAGLAWSGLRHSFGGGLSFWEGGLLSAGSDLCLELRELVVYGACGAELVELAVDVVRPGELFPPGGHRLPGLGAKLVRLLVELLLLHLQTLLRRGHIGDSLLHVLQILELALVGLVERLRGILGVIQHVRDTRW